MAVYDVLIIFLFLFFHYYYFIAISIIIWRIIDSIKDELHVQLYLVSENEWCQLWGVGGDLDIEWSSLLKTSLVSDVKWNYCCISLKLEKKPMSICILEVRRHCDIVTCDISVYRLKVHIIKGMKSMINHKNHFNLSIIFYYLCSQLNL